MQWISARPVDASLSPDQNALSQSDFRGGPITAAEMNSPEKCISPFGDEDEISLTPVLNAPVSQPISNPASPARHLRPAEPEVVTTTTNMATDPRQMWEAKMAPASNSAAALEFAKSTKESSIASIFKPFHTVALDIIGHFELLTTRRRQTAHRQAGRPLSHL
ncbi:hypothetical protein T4B_11878 [Trichinella pseudospiralis]|uniref:Uncharacterized protein n=2 Tax=Trichinella pseudospiralis TaxID=6337 RepID=A0A0V1FTV9_TRIPS|nr:hypothetical protein T4D_15491 [Trichinella pseudospiralis]KRZ25065.1 hypothetical protein T4B_11878 [Trichinella pseudospiralis]KRZ35953.1 hypothetical protein T4C_13331 [Trichinella pseudospiralis]